MDKELEDYRAKKALEFQLEANNKKIFSSPKSDLFGRTKTKFDAEEILADQEIKSPINILYATNSEVERESLLGEASPKLFWITVLLKSILWFSLWMIFVKLEFGTVFLVCSGFYFLWSSLRSGRNSKKKEGELSAYSVFNPNFEVLDGTLTAEQFDKEIRRGPI